MSSYVVGKVHIDAMLTAALNEDRGLYVYHDGVGSKVTYENVDEWGAALVAENVRSVRSRYDEVGFDDMPGPVDNGFAIAAVTNGEYHYSRTIDHDPAIVLMGILCYEYQSDDHDRLDDSKAGAFCRYLKNALIHRLPGAGDVWEITERGDPPVSLFEIARGRG